MVARKISGSPTRIWSFHSERPVTNVKLVQDFIFLGHRHYNNLVEVERDRAEAFRLIREKHVPGMDAAREGFELVEAEYKDVNKRVKEWRAQKFRDAAPKTKKTRALPPELQAEYAELKARKKALGERWRELKDKFKVLTEPAIQELTLRCTERAARTMPEFREGLDAKTLTDLRKRAAPRTKEKINAKALEEMLAEDWPEAWKEIARLDASCLHKQKTLRATSGLPNGCYSLVEKSFAQAVKTTREEKTYPPWFHRFDGRGRVGVQVTGGETFGDVLDGESKFLRLRPNAPRGGRHDAEFFTASIRLGKTEWADFPVRLHRLPPRDAALKWAWFRVHRVGGERFKYELQLTLEGEGLVTQRQFGDGGAVEVRFCSQSHDDGLRVATWLQRETGEVGDVVLPTALAQRLDYPAVLRAYADAHVDEAVRVMSLLAHLAGNRFTGWRRPSKQHKRDSERAGKSRSEGSRVALRSLCTDWANDLVGHERLTALWHEWRAERLAAGKDLFPHVGTAARWAEARGVSGAGRFAFWLFLWTLKDRHLRRSAGQMRERSEHQRDALYRNAAIALSKRFGEVVLDASDLREQKRKPKVEEESNEFQRMRTVRQNASPGRCRELFKEVFGGRVKVERSGDDATPGGARSSGEDTGSESSAVEYAAAE